MDKKAIYLKILIDKEDLNKNFQNYHKAPVTPEGEIVRLIAEQLNEFSDEYVHVELQKSVEGEKTTEICECCGQTVEALCLEGDPCNKGKLICCFYCPEREDCKEHCSYLSPLDCQAERP